MPGLADEDAPKPRRGLVQDLIVGHSDACFLVLNPPAGCPRHGTQVLAAIGCQWSEAGLEIYLFVAFAEVPPTLCSRVAPPKVYKRLSELLPSRPRGRPAPS